jgi:shikimate dehydrogenase
MTDAYGLFGYPVHHSWSPFIHGMFARQTAQDMTYRLIESPPERFRSEVLEFFSSGGCGINVTLPHKRAAADLVNELTPRAESADAVNTITRRDELLVGDNTDGAGLLADLRRILHLRLDAPRILLLGAGGAARGVIAPLLGLRPSEMTIVNHNVLRARELAERFSDMGRLHAIGYPELGNDAYDLVINATAASLAGELPALPPGIVSSRSICYDMYYGRDETPFTRWALQRGCARAIMGLGMLVEQAAESFCLWRGVRPDTAPVIAALRAPR